MRGWLVVAVVVASLGGCDKWNNRLDKMEDWKDKLCACDTPGCVVNTQREYRAWWSDVTSKDSVKGGSIAGSEVSFVAIPDDKRPRYEELQAAMRACVREETAARKHP